MVWWILCTGLWAQTPGAPDPSTLARIEGRAFNSVTGEPLRKAEVAIHGTGADYSAVSDASGHFAVEKVTPGTYTMTAEHQNYAMLNYGSTRPERPGTRLTLSAGQSMTGIELKLVPFGVISGRVVDQDGDPMTGVQIAVMRWGFMRGVRQLQSAGGGASTNDRGEYRIYNLAPGRYFLIARPMRSEMLFADGAYARRTPARAEQMQEAYTTTFYPSSPDVTAASQVPLSAGQEVPGLDIQLRKMRVHTIQGKVSELHAGHRYSITMQPQEATSTGYSGMGRAAAVRPNDGSFIFRGVAPGRYLLIVMADNRLGGRQDVTVGESDVDGLVMAVMEPGAVKGRVLMESNTTKPASLKGLRISLTPAEAVPMNIPSANPAEDGSFSLDDVPADRYKVNCSPTDGAYLKTIRLSGQVSNDGTVELTSGGAATLELVFAPTTAVIEGDVKTDDDQPSTATRVLLLPASGRESDFRTTMTDDKGHFVAKGVPPGSYTALATDGSIYGMLDPQVLKALEKVTTTVSVDENGHTTTTLKLVPDTAVEALQ